MTSAALPLQPQLQASRTACIHCGNAVSRGAEFCCEGCAAVYAWLKDQNLTEYYSVREKGAVYRAPRAVERVGSYTDLDDPALRALRDDPLEMTFYLEGFHCFACIWLLDRLPEHVSGLESVHFDPTDSLARVRITSSGKFSDVATALARLGYRPHFVPETDVQVGSRSRIRERRLDLIRLAIAGMAAGNIMMFALATYFGAPQEWERPFSWISFVVFLPVIGLSATPLFRDAWAALRSRGVTAEVPLMAGISIAAVFSAFNLLRGSDQVFFDSLSSLIFLLLASRAVLGRIQSSALGKSHLLALVTPLRVRMAADRRKVDSATLRAGDSIVVAPHEVIPVDGLVESGASHISRAALTGESNLLRAQTGTRVEAGTRNHEGELIITVTAQGYKTRLGRILRSIESGAIRKPQFVRKLERWSTVFVALVGSAALLAWHQGGWQRAVALLIIVCPCGLALAGPLTFAQGLAAAARSGIWVASGEALERLAKLRAIVFDKTGTLTEGAPEVRDWTWDTQIEQERRQTLQAVATLEIHSSHPVAAALVRYLVASQAWEPTAESAVSDFQETLGTGVSGTVAGAFWEVRKPASAQTSSSTSSPSFGGVEIWKDHVRTAQVTLSDRLRVDAQPALSQLRSQGIALYLLSGDRSEETASKGRALGFEPSEIRAQAEPEQKLAFLQGLPHAAMVGDGANDAAALAGATVGIALQGSAELALRSSDVFLGESGLNGIATLLRIARRTVRVLQIAIGFSLAYNLIAIALVLNGNVAPWLAATLMPLSALSVFMATRLGFLRRPMGGRSPL